MSRVQLPVLPPLTSSPLPSCVARGGGDTARGGGASHQDVGLRFNLAGQGEGPRRSLSQHTSVEETADHRRRFG